MPTPDKDAIAIIGMACRFPAAPSLADFWNLLREGRNGIREIPADRWDVDTLFDTDAKAAGKINTRHGGFIDDIRQFDAAFFGISPREAVQMDPQQRMLLELAYEALEDGGLDPAALAGSDTGVFVGIMSNDYLRHQTEDGYRRIDVHTGSGAGFCMLANRLSYHFDLRGPSAAVDSACSSSLVAAFQACQSLWTGESDLALAAGVNLILDPSFNVFYAKGGLSAPDGRCKTFAAAADGIGRGEGIGVVVLKRLRDALADGDPVYATIVGGAVNHDGRSNGLTAPNRWAQEQLLRKAMRHAGVGGDELQYIELHGTGTLIGDPIEANALGAVLAESRAAPEPCLVGSVKSNIGHLEGAAGVAGLIKLALSLHHGEIPPSLWFDAPNPHIDFERLPLRVNTAAAPWPGAGARTAGVSSFGLGGTNAHLLLRSAPAAAPAAAAEAAPHWLLLSAQSEAALRQQAARYAEALDGRAAAEVAALCAAAVGRRGLHDFRASVLADSGAELAALLRGFAAGDTSVPVVQGRFRPARRRLLVGVAQPQAIDTETLAAWLRAGPRARAAWEECRGAFLKAGRAGLPAAAEVGAARAPGEGDEDFTGWSFAAVYALLAQLLDSVPGIDALHPDGFAQLAAFCACGRIGLDDAVAAVGSLPGAGPRLAATAPRVACECVGGRDPELADLQWAPQPQAWRDKLAQDSGRLDADVLLLDLQPQPAPPLPPATAKTQWLDLGAGRHSFGQTFARLALRHPLRRRGLASAPAFARGPAYPWQRETYWLPRGIAAPQAAVAAAPAAEAPAAFSRAGLLAIPAAARAPRLVEYLSERVARGLHMDPAKLDPAQPLNSLGIDSLIAVEIKNRVEKDLQIKIPVVKFLAGSSILDFTELMLADIGGKAEPIVAPPSVQLAVARPEAAAAPAPAQKVAEMSMEQVDALLLQFAQQGGAPWTQR